MDEIKKTISACEVEIDCLLEILALVTEFSQTAQRELFHRTGSGKFREKNDKTYNFRDHISREAKKPTNSRNQTMKTQNSKSLSIQNSIQNSLLWCKIQKKLLAAG